MSQYTAAEIAAAQEQVTSSISDSPNAVQSAMQDQSANNPPLAQGIEALSRDVTMAGTLTPDRAASPAIPVGTNNAPSPLPRTGTPSRTNGEATSRATSVHPVTAPTMPEHAVPNGAPVRRWMNEKLAAHVLEGMKKVASERPEDPLRVLGEFLLQRSREVEEQQ